MLRHIFNTVATALLAAAIAVMLGLPGPQIAMACVFIVMQPCPSQVLAKGYYRMLGTAAGAAATWVLASGFSQSPAQFLAAVGVWATLLTGIAARHGGPATYSVVLAGYTPILIGIPALFAPAQLMAGVGNRLAEVMTGVACAVAVACLNGPAARGAGSSAAASVPAQAAASTPERTMGGAVLAGLHPAVAMAAMASLWLAVSWRGGAMATLNATVDCALVALSAQPLRMALQMSAGTLLAVAAGVLLNMCYPFLPLPAFLVFAPALCLGAWMTGRAESLGRGLGYSITLSVLAYPSADAGAQYLQDAAGLVLSVVVLTAICAVLSPLRQRLVPS